MKGAMTPDDAITALIAEVDAGRGIGGEGADDRGSESAGASLWLRREGDVYVVEEIGWHEYGGRRNEESVKRRTRTERGLRRLLREDRRLLEALLGQWSGAPAELTPPPPEAVAAREAGLDAACAAAWQRLQAGEWWVAEGRAQGLADGRGLGVAYDDALRWLSHQDAAKLRARLRAALQSETPVAFGALPLGVAEDLRRWLDPAALLQEVARDAVVVQAFGPSWCSHDEGGPESNHEMVAWSVYGVVPTRSLRPAAAAELPAALREAEAWVARRNEKAPPRPFDPAALALVEEALALAASRPLTGPAVALDGRREERELRRAGHDAWTLIWRTVPEGGAPGETDEHRSTAPESDTRAALGRLLEWLAPAVSQREAR